jgi:hypothetical protein
MKHIEYGDSNNKQDFFHGREKVSGDTEKHKSLATKRRIGHQMIFWIVNAFYVRYVLFTAISAL